MEINATITSRSGYVQCLVHRTTAPRELVVQFRQPAPVTLRRAWHPLDGYWQEDVTIEIRDPGEGK